MRGSFEGFFRVLGASGGADGEREEEEGFAGLLREQKLSAVNESIDKLQAGITDAKVSRWIK